MRATKYFRYLWCWMPQETRSSFRNLKKLQNSTKSIAWSCRQHLNFIIQIEPTPFNFLKLKHTVAGQIHKLFKRVKLGLSFKNWTSIQKTATIPVNQLKCIEILFLKQSCSLKSFKSRIDWGKIKTSAMSKNHVPLRTLIILHNLSKF